MIKIFLHELTDLFVYECLCNTHNIKLKIISKHWGSMRLVKKRLNRMVHNKNSYKYKAITRKSKRSQYSTLSKIHSIEVDSHVSRNHR